MAAGCGRGSHRGHDAWVLTAGRLQAVYLDGLGMLCASLTRDAVEILGRTDELEGYVERGSTCALPFLHPWANRLAGLRYAAAGRVVLLDPRSPLLHLDGNALPMHGVPGANLAWRTVGHAVDGETARLSAVLDWSSPERLAVFPYPHRVEMEVGLDARGLQVVTTLRPAGEESIPASFGFHPYLRLAGVPRAEWSLELPAMRRLPVDDRQIPNGVEEAFSARSLVLGDGAFDDGFRLEGDQARFALSAKGRRIGVEFQGGYPFAQIYAPVGRDFVAVEPMTAPANALASGRDLRLVEPGSELRAGFRIDCVEG